MSKLFERLEEKQKTNLLQIITKRIIINPQGVIVDQELHSPFSYLFTFAALVKGYREEGCGSEQVRLGSPESEEPIVDPERFIAILLFEKRGGIRMIWITKSIYKNQFAVRAFFPQSKKRKGQWLRMLQLEQEVKSKSQSFV